MKQMTKPADYANLYKNFSQQNPTGFKNFLQYTKFGEWVLGAEKETIAPDELIVVNHMSLQHGVIGWQDQSKVYDTLVPLTERAPDIADLPPIPESKNPKISNGYVKQMSLQAAFLDDKTKIQYSGSSKGCLGFMLRLMELMGTEIERHPDFPNPVLSLVPSFYLHPTYGKTFKPDFKEVDWASSNLELMSSVGRIADDLM